MDGVWRLRVVLALVLSVHRGTSNTTSLFMIQWINPNSNTTMVLDTKNGDLCEDATVVINKMNENSPKQYWELVDNNVFRNVASGLFLTIDPLRREYLYKYEMSMKRRNNVLHQRFTLQRNQAFRSTTTNECLTLRNNKFVRGTKVIAVKCVVDFTTRQLIPSQRWKLLHDNEIKQIVARRTTRPGRRITRPGRRTTRPGRRTTGTERTTEPG